MIPAPTTIEEAIDYMINHAAACESTSPEVAKYRIERAIHWEQEAKVNRIHAAMLIRDYGLHKVWP